MSKVQNIPKKQRKAYEAKGNKCLQLLIKKTWNLKWGNQWRRNPSFPIKKVYIYQLVGHKDEKGLKKEMAMVNDFVWFVKVMIDYGNIATRFYNCLALYLKM